MMSKTLRFLPALVLLSFLAPLPAARADQASFDAKALLKAALWKWIDLAEPAPDAPPQCLSMKLKVVEAKGLPSEAKDATVDAAYQYPDRLRIAATIAGEQHLVGRDQQVLWTHQPQKKFAIVGKSGVVRFKADPKSIDDAVMPPFQLPFSRLKVSAFMLLVKAEPIGEEKIDGFVCKVIKVTFKDAAAEILGVQNLVAQLWIRPTDLLPMRVTATDGRADVRVDVTEASIGPVKSADFWAPQSNPGDKVETVALSHLTKFLEVGPKLLDQKIPTLGPATGRSKIVAHHGKGRVEIRDGTTVLFLKGTPQEMGEQHGALLKLMIHDVAEKILYGIGVGSSFVRGNWFFGEVENAQARISPHIDPRVLSEMDALADAAGMHRQESRLANFFPELFHCSGFALLPQASADGHLYHGRVLDYLRGVGLEQNAVVIVTQPTDGRNAWVNLSYAGFVGSVTAMNEKGISIGEMGGRGYGQWDGKPMAQLMREVMEKASTLDEAIAIMKAGPRTCEYYYVIADGKSKQAVGIGATPDSFEIVRPGEKHPRLPNPSPTTVLLSAGTRYDTLSQRVKEKLGRFDAESARDLMSPPVCMHSNIQSVLFVPDTLDFYVANADGKNVASQTRYTKYNLRELLKGEGK